MHCKKRLTILPSPAGMSHTNFSLAGIAKLFPPRESLVTVILAGDGKIAKLFLQCLEIDATVLPYHRSLLNCSAVEKDTDQALPVIK
jgi:hypothetical protein